LEPAHAAHAPRMREDLGAIKTPERKGITLNGRLAVIYSRSDLGNGWERPTPAPTA